MGSRSRGQADALKGFGQLLLARAMAFWPGWRNLWYRGEVYSLAVALLFAAILNIALLATLVWPEWLSPWLVRGLWTLLTAGALGSFAASFFSTHPLTGNMLPSVEADSLLMEAQQDYLRGEYFAAEAALHRILSTGAEDIEAALLLASVLRRTGRFRQALDCLERIERLDKSRPWAAEIARERSRCQASPANSST